MSEQVAAIILAAGESKRLGSPKQLLKFKGRTFVNITIELAIECKLSPIVLVLGAYFKEIESQLVHKKDIIVIQNQDWQEGQSSSLKKGIEVVEKLNIPVIILLCDQPMLTPDVVTGVTDTHESTGVDVVMVKTNEKRTPPVLMTPACFKAIHELLGDRGARDIVNNFSIAFWNNVDERKTLDIDTKEDFEASLLFN